MKRRGFRNVWWWRWNVWNVWRTDLPIDVCSILIIYINVMLLTKLLSERHPGLSTCIPNHQCKVRKEEAHRSNGEEEEREVPIPMSSPCEELRLRLPFLRRPPRRSWQPRRRATFFEPQILRFLYLFWNFECEYVCWVWILSVDLVWIELESWEVGEGGAPFDFFRTTARRVDENLFLYCTLHSISTSSFC